MTLVLNLQRKVLAEAILPGTFPGIFDFDIIVESDADGYDESGKLIFKFRKCVIERKANDNFPSIAGFCKKTLSLRRNAAGPQEFETSRVVGYSIRRFEGFATESDFTMRNHREYKRLVPLIESIDTIYQAEFPQYYYFQKALEIDHHFFIGRTVFNQGIINKSFRTALHKDKGNVPGTISNLVCLGSENFQGGFLVLPEYRIAFNLRPRDYLGFLGQELWHGNTEILGSGTRLSLIFYAKREFVGKKFEEELVKLARFLNQQS